MRNLYRIFFKAEGASPWIAVICLLSANLASGIGLASLLPLLAVATDSDSSSPLLQFIRRGFEAFGLPLSVGPLLFFFVGALSLSSLLTLLATRYVGYAEAEVTTRLRLKLTRLLIAARWSYKEARNSVQQILFALLFGVGAYFALVIWAVPIVELIVVGVALSRAVKGVGKIQAQYQSVAVHEFPFLELQDFIRLFWQLPIAQPFLTSPIRFTRLSTVERGSCRATLTRVWTGSIFKRVGIAEPRHFAPKRSRNEPIRRHAIGGGARSQTTTTRTGSFGPCGARSPCGQMEYEM